MKVLFEGAVSPRALVNTYVQSEAFACAQAMDEVREGVLQDVRAQVRGAGLGARLANTVRGVTFPPNRKPSLDPAAFVWSKAPTLISAYANGGIIRPTDGHKYLAIPTANVPRKSRNQRMSVSDVEAAFDQPLTILKRGGRVLGFINAVQSKNDRGWRKGTRARLAQGRKIKLVLMFVLVPQVRVAKKLDLDAIADKWADRVPQLIDQNWPAT